MKRTILLGFWWMALAGCADEGVDTPPRGCGPQDPCLRGQICRLDGRCEPSADAADVLPPEDAELDATLVDASMDAALVDASMDAALDGAVDMSIDAAPSCQEGQREDCGRTIGRCRAGVRTCEGGQFGACVGSVGPMDERCNGADDDCDGVVDNGFGVGQPCDGEGRCGAGLVECKTDTQTRCSTDPGGRQAQDRPESCNGEDDDCDGVVDNGFGLGEPCTDLCGPGELECGPSGRARCSTEAGGSGSFPRPEVCNGRDDDCNGAVDDGLGLNAPCDGVGACGEGRVECDGEGGLQCSSDAQGSASHAVPERCNGQDDDCDGDTDEDFEVGRPCTGLGRCGVSVTECGPDEALLCASAPGGSASPAVPERCNGQDDDCDGDTDEGFSVGAPCTALGICPAGHLVCMNDQAQCDTHPGGPLSPAGPERCNGQDDDCDGQTDEELGLGQACDGVGACGAGLKECAPDGAVRCSTDADGSHAQAQAETCNGQDDDCDGQTDEGAACGGETCLNAPLLGLSAQGRTDGLTDDYPQSTCLSDSLGPDQVFRFSAQANVEHVVAVAPTSPTYDPLLWVSDDCDALNRCLIGRDSAGPGRPEARRFTAPRTAEFFLVVDGRDEGQGGPFVVTARPASEGESCLAPLRLPFPAAFVGTLEFRINDVSSSACPAGITTLGADQVFSFSLDAPRRVRVTLTPAATLDAVISLSTSCSRPETACEAAAQAGGAGATERLEAELPAGTHYLLVEAVGTGGAFGLMLEAL